VHASKTDIMINEQNQGLNCRCMLERPEAATGARVHFYPGIAHTVIHPYMIEDTISKALV